MLKVNFCSGLLVLIGLKLAVAEDYGFIQVKDKNGDNIELCAAFNTNFKSIHSGNPEGEWKLGQSFTNLYPALGCQNDKDAVYTDQLLILKRGNCTFAEKAVFAQTSKADGIITVSSSGILIPGATQEEYDDINVSVAVITEDSLVLLTQFLTKHLLENVRMFQYIPVAKSSIDPNAVVLWVLAVVTCAVGAWLQGVTFKDTTPKYNKLTNDDNSSTETSDNQDIEPEVDITPKIAVVFFLMCSVSILLMYFFFDYLVYVIIVVFCYASSTAMFYLLNSAFKTSPCFTRHTLPNPIPVLSLRPPILSIILFISCVTFSIVWAVYRKSSFAWLLQDILGVNFCIYMIKTIRLPNFKVCTILLVLFFIYDVFYVFITPLLTPNHESIMVHIATGGTGKTTEELPMLFKMPKFMFSPFSKCVQELPYSMLGYGDVILPGLHVGFCAIWDSKLNAGNAVKQHAYYIAAVVGYCAGLVLTFIAMVLMRTGQPALLYLVPCCLISTYIVAAKRKELNMIWNGKIVKKKSTNLKMEPENEMLLESSS
ncbi:signal peptide peptidase-like 2B [Ciona intestinalis]